MSGQRYRPSVPHPKLLASLFTSIALLSSVPSLAADKVLYTQESTPIFDKAKNRIVGSLPPGTPVRVKKRRGARTYIEVDGWSEEYHDLAVFSGQDVRIARAHLVRLRPGVRMVHEEKVDRWETKWFRVTISGWVKKKSLVSDLDRVWNAAKELHADRCTECHEWRPPETLKRTQWRGTLLIMAHRAALTPEETALLGQYLQHFARDTARD